MLQNALSGGCLASRLPDGGQSVYNLCNTEQDVAMQDFRRRREAERQRERDRALRGAAESDGGGEGQTKKWSESKDDSADEYLSKSYLD